MAICKANINTMKSSNNQLVQRNVKFETQLNQLTALNKSLLSKLETTLLSSITTSNYP